MALEKRNGHYYYYKKERDGKRVISKYYGKGELVSLLAQMDEFRRADKRLKTLENLILNREAEAFDREIDLYKNKVKKITMLRCYSFY